MHTLDTKILLPAPRAQVFDFFADPRNLERLTPSWLRFEIVNQAGIMIKQGALLDYRLRLHGIPLRWQSEISVWEPPHRFVDRQTRGPYLVWIHEHTFAEHEGGTIVGDHVDYAVPGGAIVQKLIVAPDLKKIFQYRHRILQEIFNPSEQRAAS